MTASVAKEVARAGTVVLGTTLVVVGVATAAALHRQQAMALDEALLIAAHGRAHPDVDVEVEVEHSRAPIEAWIVDPVHPNDGGIPRLLTSAALRAEAPLYATLGDRRVVLLPFEVERRGADDREELAAAAAPAVTLARSVGPFAVVYTILAALAALLAIFVQRRIVRHAFEPLERARRQAGHMTGFGAKQRLAEDGPEEIRPLLVAINGLLTRLERSHRAQSRFTAEAAHELRTPVTGMLGELDVTLRTSRSAEAYRATLVSMRDDVLRLRQLVDGLTTLSRLDAEDLSGTRELMRAGEIVAHALAAEAATLRDAGNKVTVSVEDDPEIEGNRALVEVALSNLLRNAARHAPGCDVSLRARRVGELLELVVDDAGPGIEESEREVVFDRFVRGSGARERDRDGLGLGLPITREIARRHGGDCVLERSPLGGLRARLSLRVVQRPAAA